MHRSGTLVALWIFLLARAARADVPANPAYPIALRLQFSPEALSARFEHAGPGVAAPPNPACIVPVGEQARDAYTAVVRRMFREAASGAVADLQLDVSIAAAYLRAVAAGWMVVVEHAVALKEISGAELASWQLQGESAILDEGAEGIAAAFKRAADVAARQFEWTFTDPVAVQQWLAAHSIAVRSRERSEYVAYLDAGGAWVNGFDAGAAALAVRAGIASRLFVIEIAAGRWTTSFAAQPVFGYPRGDAELPTWNLGIDVGLVHRLSSALEFRAGGGTHLLWGHADLRYVSYPAGPTERVAFSFRKLVPAVFAALLFSDAIFAGGVRMRSGLEFRRYFGASVDFAELQRTPSIVDNFFGLFFGFELPWGTASTRSRGSSR